MKKEKKETRQPRKDDRPPGVPGPIPECYLPHGRGLKDFALSEDALEDIEKRRRRRKAETAELLADLGLGPRKSWWEDD